MKALLLWMTLLLCHPVFAEGSIAFFYGQHAPILQLCSYDTIVIDPYSDFNPNDCKPNSQPIAYLSVGEVGRGVPYEKDIRPEWVIGKNTAWNNNSVMDQTNSDWHDFFINQLVESWWNKGYRGFFLDTLDSYTLAVHDPKRQQQQLEGLVNLIQHIKQRHPDAKIILNRGFHLLPQLQTQVDAVVIESLYHAWNQQKQRYEKTPRSEQQLLLKQIDVLRHMQLPIIIIDYLPPSQHVQASKLALKLTQQGLIPWITDKHLQEIYIKHVHEIPRKILLLFNNEDKLERLYIPMLHYIAPILEYMGYIPDYFDLDKTALLPTGNLKTKYAGIILWLETENSKNKALLQWVLQQIQHQIPVVYLNGFGMPMNTNTFARLGLSSSIAHNSPSPLKITTIDSHVVGYETKPLTMPYYFHPLRSLDSRILLQVKNKQGQTEDAVAITPWGGYALTPYVIQFLPNHYALWVIDPFKFFSQALRLHPYPIPDISTENGRRLMSVHIDGDGFANRAKWIGGRFAAEELRDQILKKFPVPTSFSVITGELAPNGSNAQLSPQLMSIARSIFALPWIEIASHSFEHPFNWKTTSEKHRQTPLNQRYVLEIPHYQFNLKTEIQGSIDFINQYLAPPNKKSNLLFWSGAANPSIQDLKLAKYLNILSINGLSDTNIDDHHPSITGIRPMGITIKNAYQVFAPIEMDFYFINNFNGPLYGFKNVIQTFQRTDKPRRTKPIDIYYHIYAASNPATLQALKKVYQWALSQPVMNIYISDYIKKVLDYNYITIGKSNGSWMIHSNSDLRELRSSHALGYPDLNHSRNVVGFKENQPDLYVHLGPERLTVLNYQTKKPTEPYLVEANGRVARFFRKPQTQDEKKRTNPASLVMQLQGNMPLQFTLANVNQCHVVSKQTLTLKHNPDQTITYFSSEQSVEIHITC